MPKYQVVLKETILHTVFVDSDTPRPEYQIGFYAVTGFNDGDLCDSDAERLQLEVSKVTLMEETDA